MDEKEIGHNVLSIMQVNNGFLLEDSFGITVIEDDLNAEDTMCRLLTKVAECYGYSYDKFSSTNLNVSFDKPGHKVC
jgi:hypothetical protein